MSAIFEDARTSPLPEIATSKRRLSSDALDSESGEPAAKRVKSDAPSIVTKAASGSPDIQPENVSTARDKKRRRKKKRKQSVVAAAQKVAAEDNGQKTADARDSSLPAPIGKPESVNPSPQEAPTIHAASPAAQSKPASRTYASRGVGTDAPTSPPKTDKGKARAISPSPTIEPVAGPSSSSATATPNSLATHQALLSTLLPSLTCQICLLLMHRPFALAPCGHIACHSCLTSWFKNGTDAVNAAPVVPIVPAPQAAPNAAANGQHPNANANANGNGNVHANGNVHVPPAVPAPPPRVPPARAALRKKKTCPHCRAVVHDRPIEVWSLKEMVLSVAKSGLADPESVPLELRPSTSTVPAAVHAPGVSDDPWHGIFAPIGKAHAVFDPYDDDYDDYDDMPLDWLEFAPGLGDAGRMGIRDDEDGGVYRCVGCMHEIWDGECTHCGRLYPGHRGHRHGSAPPGYGRDDDEDVGVDEAALEAVAAAQLAAAALDFEEYEDSDDSEDLNRRLEDVYGVVGAHADEAEDDLADGDDDDEDDEYGGSFIDDGSDDEVVELPAPYGRRAAPIVISDDEEVEVIAPPAPLRRGARRGVTRVVSEDEDEEDVLGDDENQEPQNADDANDLAQIVAAREREMYGDDGSIPARGHLPPRYMSEDGEQDRDYDSAASDEYEAHNPYLARVDRPWQFVAEWTEDEDEGEDLY